MSHVIKLSFSFCIYNRLLGELKSTAVKNVFPCCTTMTFKWQTTTKNLGKCTGSVLGDFSATKYLRYDLKQKIPFDLAGPKILITQKLDGWTHKNRKSLIFRRIYNTEHSINNTLYSVSEEGHMSTIYMCYLH